MGIYLNDACRHAGEIPQAYFDAIVKHANPLQVAEALKTFHYNLEIPQAYFDAIVKHVKPLEVAHALEILASCTDGDNYQADADAITIHANPMEVAGALGVLHRANLLMGETAQVHRDAITKHAKPRQAAAALELLHQVELLTGDNINKITELAEPEFVTAALRTLHGQQAIIGETAQSIFDMLINHSPILCSEDTAYLWGRIPGLTQAQFARMIEICINYKDNPGEGRRRFIAYVNRNILNIDEVRDRDLVNGAQSTHTASVHVATDLTAWLLLVKNAFLKTEINLNAVADAIETKLPEEKTRIQRLIQSLESDVKLPADKQTVQMEVARRQLSSLEELEPKTQVALACLRRLQRVPCDLELDVGNKEKAWAYLIETEASQDEAIQALLPQLEENMSRPSRLSLQQFIFWSYEDIKENPVLDYLPALIDALYEVQRGYNLDEKGTDNGRAAASICYGGTANKFCERLKGLSSLIQFIFINEGTITAKIQQLLLNKVLTHCQSLLKQAEEGDRLKKAEFCALISKLTDNESAADAFQDFFNPEEIEQQLQDEFKVYLILNGSEALQRILANYSNDCLPYIPSINAQVSIYSTSMHSDFQKLIAAKTELEQDQSISSPVAESLAKIGFLQAPREQVKSVHQSSELSMGG